jgi:hypothetical protein
MFDSKRPSTLVEYGGWQLHHHNSNRFIALHRVGESSTPRSHRVYLSPAVLDILMPGSLAQWGMPFRTVNDSMTDVPVWPVASLIILWILKAAVEPGP